MKTFKQFREDEVQEDGLLGKIFKKKPAKPAKPAFKSWKATNDHSEYRTGHHYGVGDDIDPQSVPEFKPSWQTARG
jgi:hypothetical protein